MDEALVNLLRPSRGVDESFDAYKKRRRMANAYLKYAKRGRLVFDSSRPLPHEPKSLTNKGKTYRKPKK